jgi:hypothetical protein
VCLDETLYSLVRKENVEVLSEARLVI